MIPGEDFYFVKSGEVNDCTSTSKYDIPSIDSISADDYTYNCTLDS